MSKIDERFPAFILLHCHTSRCTLTMAVYTFESVQKRSKSINRNDAFVCLNQTTDKSSTFFRYSQSSMTKSSSVEDTTFVDGLYAPPPPSSVLNQRRSIPNLDSKDHHRHHHQDKDISNQLCTRSWSYNFDIERNGKHPPHDGSYGQSLPAITVEESGLVLRQRHFH